MNPEYHKLWNEYLHFYGVALAEEEENDKKVHFDSTYNICWAGVVE